MANVRLTWELPAVSQRQRPIAHVKIGARVSVDLPWTPIAEVPASQAELLLEDVAPGEWFYRGRAFDDRGGEGPEAFTSVSLDYDPPGAVGNFVATVE